MSLAEYWRPFPTSSCKIVRAVDRVAAVNTEGDSGTCAEDGEIHESPDVKEGPSS